MQSSQPLGKLPSKYQVLIASAAEATTRLLQPLQHIGQVEGVADSGGLFVLPRQRFVFHPLEHSVLNVVLRSFQADTPVAVVIVDVQPGTESTAENLINALYHADGSLGVIVLLGEGASLSASLLEQITHSPRLTFVQMPGTLPQIFQIVKIMLMSWHAQRRLTDPMGKVGTELALMSGGGATTEVPSSAPPMHLEIVGSLAAGIAHEFNNVLTVIQSQMDMAMKQAGEMPGVLSLLSQVMETAKSASTLSRKLVSFTPDEGSEGSSVDLTAALDEEVMLLNKTLGDHFTLEVTHAPALPKIWADPSTISQLIINVALHARNGMPDGGRLQISTSEITHQTGGKYARLFPEAAHGEYVMLTIEDPNPSDEGMADPSRVVVNLPPSVQRAADDRLAWIQRTIQAAGGGLNVTLLPGMVRLYQLLFPLAKDHEQESAVDQAPVPVSEVAKPAEAVVGNVPPSTVLVVDDDDTICMIMSQVLATEKHRVLTAKSADEAWQQWCQHRSSIKLLITDINMPGGANGVALGHAIQEQDGSVPVIYTSGHRAVHQFAELEIGTNYLPKPFGMNDLLAVANRALMTHRSHGLS